MRVNLGDGDAAVGIALDVVTDYLAELARLGRLPSRVELTREFGGQTYDVVVLLDPPTFAMVETSGAPYTVLRLTGTIEARPQGQPAADPIELPLTAAVRLALVLFPGAGLPQVGLRYDGVEGTPSFPLTAADVETFFAAPDVLDLLAGIRLPLADTLVLGLTPIRFPEPATPPAPGDWAVALTLLPSGGDDTADAFAVSVGVPGSTAVPPVTESFVPARTGLAIAYNRPFLDLVLAAGAAATVGTEVAGAEVTRLTLRMADTGIAVDGHVVKAIDTPGVDVLPDVDIDFDGIAIPRLVRGTVGLWMDTTGIDVDVDDGDEIFYGALRWVLTVGAAALCFTGVGWLTLGGIALWLTVVDYVWDRGAELEGAPGVLRQSFGASLGAQLSKLAEALDDSTPAGELTVDGTPDSATVADGCIVLAAQVIVRPIAARLRSAEYSKRLRRFGVVELADRRRFRTQELARLMKAGKVTVPGFHDVDGDHIRSDHDASAANNLLRTFENSPATEPVVPNVR